MDLPPAGSMRLSRESLTNVLIIGGSAERREQVARAFHQESPLQSGAFVRVECDRDHDRLREALADWEAATPGESNPFRAAERGTLYLDSVGALALDSQRVLLALARRFHAADAAGGAGRRPGRLVAGHPAPLADAVAEGRFLATLHDALDKVRVQLEVSPRAPA